MALKGNELLTVALVVIVSICIMLGVILYKCPKKDNESIEFIKRRKKWKLGGQKHATLNNIRIWCI